MNTPPWYVLTGGPCAGKTTTIDALARRGHPAIAEPARLIIEEHLAQGQSIHEIVGNPEWLPSVIHRAREMHRGVSRDELHFFDRGVPDSLAYYKLAHRPVEDFFREALSEIRYRKVFLLDLVDFINDSARSETPEQAMILHGAIREAYLDQGYEIVEVPVMPVDARAEYILENL